MGRGVIALVIALGLVLALAVGVRAEPSGATLTPGASERAQLGSPESLQVQAGNVTELNISGTSITQSWAGFYGDVTGTIVLEDANGNKFYDWTAANPQGEVYAARVSSITWSNVRCANSTEIANENTALNMGSSADNITNTFNSNTHPQFYVGSVNIAANSCSATNAYVNGAAQSSDFYNVLLSDGTGNIIYTAILDPDTTGFDGDTHDFELLVGEDGHGAAAGTTTTYYFWVEIE